ncbi:tetratricopeptide repeat protein [Desulfurobacterium atlanticum]|uniref:Tetratricopeptide repeat-containing protein n=1 Tax=Desulfurobacterium atlanticum TaxID=240169 RepID=A0A238ZFG5_9BACT|nr:tetratricopeptide repeat protein [Desulfurobacterium atlanticum]SNR81889.1 Tetratricopeptide repeat-containing protein [Desulfurobacterium atlanticum]
MRKLTISRTLIKIIFGFLLIFSVSLPAIAQPSNVENKTENPPTIESIIGKLETKLKENAPFSEIENLTKETFSLKRKSSIFYIPEINFLLNRQVEKIPESQTATFRKRILQMDTIISGLTTILTIFGAFSLIYFADKVFSSEIKRNTAILIGACLIFTGLLFQGYLFYAVFGILAGIGFISRNKIPFSILMLIILSLHLVSQTVNKAFFEAANLPKNQLIDKLKRDNYSPYFLISNSSLSKIEKEIATMANKQALLYEINIDTWKKLLENRLSPEEKAIILNNIGCILYKHGNLKEAIKYFEEARKVYPTPKTYYNLFLTYSSLFEPDKADFYSKKLKNYSYFFQKEIPLVANIGDVYKIILKVNIPFTSIVIIIATFLISSITAGKFIKKLSFISINPFYNNYLPGYSLYYNNNYGGIILFIISIFILELLVRSLCLMNL